jgi:hypothetical protein
MIAICQAPVSVTAQNWTANEKANLHAFVRQYRLFYNQVKIQAAPEVLHNSFFKLFIEGPVPMYNDYFNGGSESFSSQSLYFKDITSFLVRNKPVRQLEVKISDSPNIYYARKGAEYYVWIHKNFSYTFMGDKQSREGWIKLNIQWISVSLSYKIVRVDKAGPPPDEDMDMIPDRYDSCKHTEQGARTNIYGCPFYVEQKVVESSETTWPRVEEVHVQESDLSKKENDRAATKKKKEAKKKKDPNPPSTRFGFAFAGGGVSYWPFNTSFSRRELMDKRQYRFLDSGGVAFDLGYTAGFSLHYNITRWIGASVGYQGFKTRVEGDVLAGEVGDYLNHQGRTFDKVSISSEGYHKHALYAALSLGYLKGARNSFKIEAFIGRVYTDFLLPNEMNIDIKYGSKLARQKVSLKHEPFTLYGVKADLQWGLDRKANLRFQLSGHYYWGKSGDTSEHVPIDDLPEKIRIAAPDLEMAGLTVGFYINFKTPKNFINHR